MPSASGSEAVRLRMGQDLGVGKHKVDIRFRREDEQTTFEVIKGNPQAGRALPSGVKVSTAKDRLRSDLADNAPRKQSIVRHNNARLTHADRRTAAKP